MLSLLLVLFPDVSAQYPSQYLVILLCICRHETLFHISALHKHFSGFVKLLSFLIPDVLFLKQGLCQYFSVEHPSSPLQVQLFKWKIRVRVKFSLSSRVFDRITVVTGFLMETKSMMGVKLEYLTIILTVME